MMIGFTALLEARNPSLGRSRAYLLEAGTDLLGAWLVRCHLRENRSTGAAHRLAYQFRQLNDPHQWFPVSLEN